MKVIFNDVHIKDAIASTVPRTYEIFEAVPLYGLIRVCALKPTSLGTEYLTVYLRQTDGKVLFTTIDELERS